MNDPSNDNPTPPPTPENPAARDAASAASSGFGDADPVINPLLPPGSQPLPPVAPAPAVPVVRLQAAPPMPLLFAGVTVTPAAVLPRYSPTETPPATKELLLFWCLGVLGTWVISNIQDGPNTATRWIMFSCMATLCLVWPALRLSQDRVTVMLRPGQRPHESFAPNIPLAHILRLPSRLFPDSPSSAMTAYAPITTGLIFIDWIHLILITQVIIWPLHYQRGWRLPQTFAIDGAFILWSLLAAGIVALGVRAGTVRARMIAMACCIAVVFGEPLMMYLLDVLAGGRHGPGVAWDWRISPIQMVWQLSMDSNEFELNTVFRPFATIGLMAAAAWLLTLRRRA